MTRKTISSLTTLEYSASDLSSSKVVYFAWLLQDLTMNLKNGSAAVSSAGAYHLLQWLKDFRKLPWDPLSLSIRVDPGNPSRSSWSHLAGFLWSWKVLAASRVFFKIPVFPKGVIPCTFLYKLSHVTSCVEEKLAEKGHRFGRKGREILEAQDKGTEIREEKSQRRALSVWKASLISLGNSSQNSPCLSFLLIKLGCGR